MTPKEFVTQFTGQSIDCDAAYGVQCVDGFKVFCRWAGIPVKATPNNWANGYWLYRDDLGYSQYFDYVEDPAQLRDGDWAIWDKGSSCPLSHISMYYEGKFFGERQINGDPSFSLVTLQKDIIGALRWKGWNEMDEFSYGVNYRNFEDAELTIYKSPDKCQLYYLSAGAGQVKNLQEFDSPDLWIVAAINGGYFQNRSDVPDHPYGEHYGVEQTHDGMNITLAPNGKGLLTWYQDKAGNLGVVDASEYWLPPEQVNFAATPYSVLIEDGKVANKISTALGSKETIKTQQTMIARVNDRWFFICCRSAVYPAVMLRYALHIGADWATLWDSGGSTQMMAFAGTTYRKEIYTGRKISTAWVLAQPKAGDFEPIQSDPQEGGEDTMPVDNGSQNNNVEAPKPITGASILSSEMYDRIKQLMTVLGAIETVWLALAKIWGIPYGVEIGATIGALITGLSYLMNSSSAKFWTDKEIVQKKEE